MRRQATSRGRRTLRSLALGSLLLLAGCASTTVELSGDAPTASLCEAAGENINAVVLWGPHWRPDQKNVPLREAAADQGIEQFFAGSACYSSTEIRRVLLATPPSPAELARYVAEASPGANRVLVLTIRELGPVVKLLGSPALVEGGTEVVLQVHSFDLGRPSSNYDFTIHWQSGGPGVIKGVATLPEDVRSALQIGLKPRSMPNSFP